MPTRFYFFIYFIAAGCLAPLHVAAIMALPAYSLFHLLKLRQDTFPFVTQLLCLALELGNDSTLTRFLFAEVFQFLFRRSDAFERTEGH